MTSRLEDAQARCEAATPGPWATKYGFRISEVVRLIKGRVGGRVALCHDWRPGEDEPVVTQEDAEFIANARQDLPDALAVVAAVLSLPECPICKQSDLAADPGRWSHKPDCPMAKWETGANTNE